MLKEKYILEDGTKLNIGYIDKVLFESYEPILFVTKNNKDELFLCCHAIHNLERNEFLVVETTPEIIIKLLIDKITIQKAFLSSPGIKYTIININKEDEEVLTNSSAWDHLSEDNLLPADEYMEAEDGEFNELLHYYISLRMNKNNY